MRNMRNMFRTSPSNYSFHALKVLSITSMTAVIASCVFGMISLKIIRFMADLVTILLAFLLICSEIYPLAVFSYMSFIYTPTGRFLFFAGIGAITITGSLLNILAGSYTIAVGFIQYFACKKLRGVPKPFLHRNIENVPLNNANIVFASNQSNQSQQNIPTVTI